MNKVLGRWAEVIADARRHSETYTEPIARRDCLIALAAEVERLEAEMEAMQGKLDTIYDDAAIDAWMGEDA